MSNSYSSDQDDYTVTVGAEYRASLGDWKISYRLNDRESNFAGEDYLSTTELSIDARKQWSKSTEVRIRLKRDERARLKLDYRYQINSGWAINFEILYTDNQSNDTNFEYDKYTALTGFTALF